MPQGTVRGTEVDLRDRTYDGREESGQLSGGLGQLVDGHRGQDNGFRIDIDGQGKGKPAFSVYDNIVCITLIYKLFTIYLIVKPILSVIFYRI